MSRVNSTEKNAAEVSKNAISTPNSTEEPETASCQDFDLSLSKVSPIHTEEVSIGKISRSAVSSLSKLIAGDITSFISITEDRINLTFSFPKSDFGQMSLAVLQELGKVDSNKDENKHAVSKTLKSPLTNGSDTLRETSTMFGETNRSFLSEVAHRCDMNNSEDILTAFMKESFASNPEFDRSKYPKDFVSNPSEFSASSNCDHEKEIDSKIDKSFENSKQDSLKTSSKNASNTSIGVPNGTLKNKNSRICTKEATSEVSITDAGISESDTNMSVSALSVQMTPKSRKSLELKVDPTRSLSIEFGCSTTEVDKNNECVPNRNNDLKDKMVCPVPEYYTLNSKSETRLIKDNTDCDLTVGVTKNSPEIEKTSSSNTNSEKNLQMISVPNSEEISSTGSESEEIKILEKCSLNTSLKASALQDYSRKADKKGFFDGDNKESGEHISTKNLKFDAWPEITPFTKIYKIPAKEIESLVSTDTVIKYFRLELPSTCIVVKTILEGVNISVEIGEYKGSDSCSGQSFEAASERMDTLNVSSKTDMCDQGAKRKISDIGVQTNKQVNGDPISPLLDEITTAENEYERTKITLKIHPLSELEKNSDSEDCNTLDKGNLSNKFFSRHTSSVIQCDATKYRKKGNSNLERLYENNDEDSRHKIPHFGIYDSEPYSSETSCKENLSSSMSNTAPTETSQLRTFRETPTSRISENRSDRVITGRVQSTRSLSKVFSSFSSKYKKVSHTSTPSGTPKRLSLMFAAEIASESERGSEMLQDLPQESLFFSKQSGTKLASHEFTRTITDDSYSTTTENEAIRDESISNSNPTPNDNSVDVSTRPASVVDNVTTTNSITSIDDCGNVASSTFEEKGISQVVEGEIQQSTTAVEDEAVQSPAVENEAVSILTEVEDEAPSSLSEDVTDKDAPSTSVTIENKAVFLIFAEIEDKTPSSLSAAVADKDAPSTSGTIENEDASTSEEIEGGTLSPREVEDDSQTSVAVADAETSSKVTTKSPRTIPKSEAMGVSVVKDGAVSHTQTDSVSVVPPSSQYSGSRDPAKPGSEVIFTRTEAEVNPDPSSPTSSEVLQTIIAEADHLSSQAEQSGNPSSAKSQPQEDEISAGLTASTCEEIEGGTLSPREVADDSQTSVAVADDAENSSKVYDEASESPTTIAKSEAMGVSVVKDGASHTQTDSVSVVPPSSQHSGSRDPAEPGSEEIFTRTEAEVNPDPSSPTSSEVLQTIIADAEANRLSIQAEQSRNPSSAKSQTEEDEISTGLTAESNEETAAENSSVTSVVEDPDMVDSASSDATESSSSSKLEGVPRSGVRSEDDSSKDPEMSDETGGDPKEIASFKVEREKEKGSRASSTDSGKSKSFSRTKRNLKDVKRSSVDEVDLAPTRVRSRNLPSSLWKDSIPEDSAVTAIHVKYTSRASSSIAKPTSPSKRNLRSKSLEQSPTKTPTKSSSKKVVSGKPVPFENEAVVRVKRSESDSDKGAKIKLRSSPRKVRTTASTHEVTKSSGVGASESESAKSRSTSNTTFVNIRRSKRGAKD